MYTDPKDNDIPEDNLHDENTPPAETPSDFSDQVDAVAVPSIRPPRPPRAHIKTTPAQVEAAYRPKIAEGIVTEEEVSKLLWLLQVGKDRKLNLAGLAQLIDYDSTTLLRVFSGTYTASLDRLISQIDHFKASGSARIRVTHVRFVTTSISTTLFQIFDTARAYQTLLLVDGESQVGKTTAAEEYQRLNNHGATYYVRMPDGGNLGEFLAALARVMGLNAHARNCTLLKARIKSALNEKKLIIIDEIDETVIVQGGKGGIRYSTLAFIRTLHDECRCGVVLIGTHIFRDEIERGRAKEILERMRRRKMATIQMPPIIPDEDMDAIAAAYGLPPADDATARIRLEIVQDHGLRAYTNYLKAGAVRASKLKTRLRWTHFIEAHDILQKLSYRKDAA